MLLPSLTRTALVNRLICSHFSLSTKLAGQALTTLFVNLEEPGHRLYRLSRALSRPGHCRTPTIGSCGVTLYIHTYVFFRAGEHIETKRQNGSTEEHAFSRGESSSSKDAQAIAFGYVFLGCMVSEL